MVQNVKFLPVDKNSDLSLNLNSTCHHEYRVLLDFQNRAPDVKKLKFYANWDNSTYLKNAIFNGSSFSNSHIAIEFVASK